MNIILFGPPGAGKGTQAQFIVKKHNYFHLSTGDLLRNETKKKTSLGLEIEKLIINGKFVSDTIINSLLKQSLTNIKFRDRIWIKNFMQKKFINADKKVEQIKAKK